MRQRLRSYGTSLQDDEAVAASAQPLGAADGDVPREELVAESVADARKRIALTVRIAEKRRLHRLLTTIDEKLREDA